jgi:hypothetical protein
MIDDKERIYTNYWILVSHVPMTNSNLSISCMDH